MKTTTLLLVAIVGGIFCGPTGRAQPSPCANCLFLNSWSFPDTNWLSDAGYVPVNFSNIVNVDGSPGTSLLLDSTNTTPAFLFYNVIETNSDSSLFTNITTATGSISVWFNPAWSSTNQGGTGPGNYANLISLGRAGTNGPWWSWYLSPDGCNVYFASQTNGGSVSNYLSAPVSLLGTNWYNLVLTYSATNSAFYTNGVLVANGSGVAYWPGPDITFFSVGSDSNGLYQARGLFSDVETYNYQLNSNYVWSTFGMYSIFYGLGGSGAIVNGLTNAPSPLTPAPRWFSGLGDLMPSGTTEACTSNVNVWITNVSAILSNNGTASVTFTIAGGLNTEFYDVFGTTALTKPLTNASWAWLGEGQSCHIYRITNLPNSSVFLMLGIANDHDGDGLTDAFETLVSHTSTNTANTYGSLPDAWVALNGLMGTNGLAGLDPDLDGLNNGQEYLYGTRPLVPEGTTIWIINPAGYSGIP